MVLKGIVGNDVGKSLGPDLTGGSSGMYTQESGHILGGKSHWSNWRVLLDHELKVELQSSMTSSSRMATPTVPSAQSLPHWCSVLEAHLKRAFCKLHFIGGYHHYIWYRGSSYIFLAIFFLLESISLWFSTWNRHVFPSFTSLSYFLFFPNISSWGNYNRIITILLDDSAILLGEEITSWILGASERAIKALRWFPSAMKVHMYEGI